MIWEQLPIESDAVKWGFQVVNCGKIENPPHAPYIKTESDEMLWWDVGRKLDMYNIGYIIEGRGVFESEATGLIRLRAGHVLVLFPDVWHRYRPFSRTGWYEIWISFDGEHAKPIMREFFSPETPVLRIGPNEELVNQMHSLLDLVHVAPAGYQQIMAGRTVEILAQIRSLALSYHEPDRILADKIQKARCAIMEHAGDDIDLHAIARNIGMSYSYFRAAFKAETGTSPRQYQLEVRMNRARNLLLNTQASVSDIAQRLGFSSIYYFSRMFKERTGFSPTQYRNR